MAIGLGTYLALASLLFGIGAVGFLTRRNVLLQLMSIEIMLNSVNLTLVAFNRWSPGTPGEWADRGLLGELAMQGRTVLISSHDPLVCEAVQVGRVIELHDGCVVGDSQC